MNTNVEETFTNIAKILHKSKPASSSNQENKPKGEKIKSQVRQNREVEGTGP